jgi:transposase
VELSKAEVKQRLIRLGNLEHLHIRAKERIAFLEQENRQLKARIKELEKRDNDKNQKIEALAFQLEQIKDKLFGKKPGVKMAAVKKDKRERDIFSYRRPVPDKITETRLHPVNQCSFCHGKLKQRRLKTFFEEDIPLPIQKIVVRHEVEVGYCPSCKRQSSGMPVPSKRATLGHNVRKYLCILSIANRLSHTQIQDHLRDVWSLDLSIGEIGNILQTESRNLRPEYQSLKQSVLSQNGTHYDETGWKVQKEEQGKFAWVAAGAENNDTVFSLGKSRGQGNIDDIGKAKLGITDDYGAYKNAFKNHQLCWAHPQRKLRDLALSAEFRDSQKEQALKAYQQFSSLYRRIRKKIGQELSPYLKTRFQRLFSQIAKPRNLDPAPLLKLKTGLLKNKQKYFTFLNHPGIPIDNNKAERALRHLVIKRRISFGSKTQRGAETTAILASVIMSLKWNEPENWFQKYLKLTPQKTA